MSHPARVFAAIDGGRRLTRIGGGYETEVYRTAARRHVVKIKRERLPSADVAQSEARAMRDLAAWFALTLGPQHSIRTEYVIARDDAGAIDVLAIQPFVDGARPLDTVDHQRLSRCERVAVADQLRDIIGRARRSYRQRGITPDLYGLPSHDISPERWPALVWDFLARRTLLRSHNLLLTDAPERRVVLVDYDLAYRRRHPSLRRIYFAVRVLLFWRDLLVLRRVTPAGCRPRT
jgi:hypothetical protein